jgi:hypothetical protein
MDGDEAHAVKIAAAATKMNRFMAPPSYDYGAHRRVDDYNNAMRSQRPALAAALLAVVIACHSPTSPTDGKSVGGSASTEHGRLSGVVTIGPNCPGPEREGNPCPTQPSAYAARKIQVWNEAKTNLLFTVDIDSQGLYLIDLAAPAKYTIDLKPNGIDSTSDLPKVVDIHANTVTKVDVKIDTGLR